jgi:hypothetical protein
MPMHAGIRAGSEGGQAPVDLQHGLLTVCADNVLHCRGVVMLFNAVSKAQRAQQETAAGAAKVGRYEIWATVHMPTEVASHN